MNEDYSQPDFYRFNSDSIDLIRWVEKTAIKPRNILDLGAGCGIIGIELARFFMPKKITFVEFQKEYESHLLKNLQFFLPSEINAEIKTTSFGKLELNEKFDLIVSNPPYYLPGKGELPQNPQRAIARTFMMDTWDDLLRVVSHHLSPSGIAFLVLKKEETLLEMIRSLCGKYDLKCVVQNRDNVAIVELLALNKDRD